MRGWTVLGLLVGASIAGRALAGLRIDGLWIAPDEMIWGELGRSLWQDGELRVFGEETPFFGLVYPALVGGPLTLGGLAALKVVQAVVMSLAAVPVFLWGRRLAGERWALVAAGLTLAVPGLLYTGLLMSEVAFYPAVALAAWAIAAALERPTPLRQALLVGALVLAAATRLQALVLPLALLSAAVVHGFLIRDARRPLRLWPSFAALVVLAAAWVAARGLGGALGAYSVTGERSYSPGEVARFALYHLGDVAVLTALFPLCALALLLLVRDRSEPLAAYLATAVSLVVWSTVQVGAFASEYVGRLAERTLLPLAPVLFVGFAAWLSRGGPRPRLRTAAVALGALALLLVLPLRDLVVQPAVPDAFTLVPLLWLRERLADGTFELAVWAAAAAALALFSLLPRRALLVLPALAVGFLVFASFAATREVQQRVAFDQRNLLGGERDWVDAAADGPVAYLVVGRQNPNLGWHQLFWNEGIRAVYALGAFQEGLPPHQNVFARDDGRLGISEELVVAPTSVRLVGAELASIAIREYEDIGLTLWRVEPPARVSSMRFGVRAEGDMHEPGRLTAYDCQGGRLELTLLPKASTRVELRVNRVTVQVLDDIAGLEFVQAVVEPPPGAEVCFFEVVPDSLLGSTRFEFVRD